VDLFVINFLFHVGWAKYYEFNESDLKVACDTLDTWIDTMALGRTNLPPEKVPWDALSTLLSQCIYGGKIDNEFDQRLLASFLAKLFTPKSFEADFLLVSSQEVQSGDSCRIVMPEGIRRDQFLQWIEALSDRQYPAWLGLPNNAEKVLLTTRGTDMVTKLLKMQLLEDDDDDEDDSAYLASAQRDKDNAAAQRSDGRPAWMRSLLESARTWMGLLPDSLVTLRRTVENIKDPLYRFFEREVNSGSKLLLDVRQDLNDVVHICQVNIFICLY
jgi:dynein heavy chain 1